MRRFAVVALAVLAPVASCFGQYFILDLDSQDPANRDVTIGPVYEANNLFGKSRHYEQGVAADLEDDWSMDLQLRYGQYNTAGAVHFPGVWASSNVCSYMNLTNLVPEARDWYFEIIGTHTSGYVLTYAAGTFKVEYSPGSSTNLSILLADYNATWWTNNVGATVTTNTARIAALEARSNAWNQAGTDATAYTNWASTNTLAADITALEGQTSTWNTVTGKLATTTFTSWTNAQTATNAAIDTRVTALEAGTSTWNDVTNKLATSTFSTYTNSIGDGTAYLKTDGSRHADYLFAGPTASVESVEITANSNWTFGGFAAWYGGQIKTDVGQSGTATTNWNGDFGRMYRLQFKSNTESDQSMTVALGEYTNTISSFDGTTTVYTVANATNNILLTMNAGAAAYMWVSNFTVSPIATGTLAAAYEVVGRHGRFGSLNVDGTTIPTGTINQITISGASSNSATKTGNSVALTVRTNFVDTVTLTESTSNSASIADNELTLIVKTNYVAESGTFTNLILNGSNHTATATINPGTATAFRVSSGDYYIDVTTNPADVSTWSTYVASGDVDMSSNALQGIIITTDITGTTNNTATNGANATGYAHQGSYSPSNCFDGSYDGGNDYYFNDGGSSGDWWLKYDYGSGTNEALTNYVVTTASIAAQSPDDWSLYGSTDGSAWTLLHSQTNAGLDGSGDAVTNNVSNSTEYRYYSITNIYNTGGGSYLAVALVEFYTGTSTSTTNTKNNVWYVDVPASNNAAGDKGDIAFATNFLYLCVSNATWRRCAIATW